jgi:hypothetical protein
MGASTAPAQSTASPNHQQGAAVTEHTRLPSADWNWTPPAFAELDAAASTRSSFTLDRNTLGLASALLAGGDQQTRQAIDRIDGVSVRILRFGPDRVLNADAVNSVRQAYRGRGWTHLVTNTGVLPASAGAPLPHPGNRLDKLKDNGTTDLWLAMDGTNVRGAVVLVQSPRSVTLVTMGGNISPVDLLHLRGHFGIPRFDGEQFKTVQDH